MDLADGETDGVGDGGILGEPPPDEPSGDVPFGASPSEESSDDSSSSEESPADCSEISSAEGFEETGAGVPVAWGEVEEGGTVPCEPAPGAVILEPDL